MCLFWNIRWGLLKHFPGILSEIKLGFSHKFRNSLFNKICFSKNFITITFRSSYRDSYKTCKRILSDFFKTASYDSFGKFIWRLLSKSLRRLFWVISHRFLRNSSRTPSKILSAILFSKKKSLWRNSSYDYYTQS